MNVSMITKELPIPNKKQVLQTHKLRYVDHGIIDEVTARSFYFSSRVDKYYLFRYASDMADRWRPETYKASRDLDPAFYCVDLYSALKQGSISEASALAKLINFWYVIMWHDKIPDMYPAKTRPVLTLSDLVGGVAARTVDNKLAIYYPQYDMIMRLGIK